ncbi:MAG: hypothetical protein EZS28_026964 [Streblomastix strix]|uniref:Uncharacterized protein n=1 Tax=Streblomastix strix TaxID=222440 RepID=A0A5J4V5D5_9EUKA|nr:MAG: hypothetical protein EZS28_026964 [Streblomastix strix]
MKQLECDIRRLKKEKHNELEKAKKDCENEVRDVTNSAFAQIENLKRIIEDRRLNFKGIVKPYINWRKNNIIKQADIERKILNVKIEQKEDEKSELENKLDIQIQANKDNKDRRSKKVVQELEQLRSKKKEQQRAENELSRLRQQLDNYQKNKRPIKEELEQRRREVDKQIEYIRSINCIIRNGQVINWVNDG